MRTMVRRTPKNNYEANNDRNRQKCVNWTRDILMLKARKMTTLAIIMFQENVHEGAFFDLKTSLKF